MLAWDCSPSTAAACDRRGLDWLDSLWGSQRRRSRERNVFGLGLMLLWVSCQVQPSPAAETNVARFTQPAPYSSEDEIGRRFGFRPPLPEYDVTREKFRLVVPATYCTNTAWGLLVWLSQGDDAYLPPDWEEELEKHDVIVAAPFNSGNERHPIDRLRLALDATANVCRRFRIDRNRLYVGGFSDGARLACVLGIACGDIFTGTLCVCGANFYLHIPAGGNQYIPGSFFPSVDILQYARLHGKYVLVTGEADPSRETVQLVVEGGLLADGFKHVLLINVPGLQPAIPGLAPLKQALAFLDGKAPPAAPAKP